MMVGGSRMGNKARAVLLIFFSYLCVFATSSPVQKASTSSDSLQEKSLGAKIAGHGGARSTGPREIGNGRSRSPDAQGGTSFIPVYAAGAASSHRQNHHHGSGNCNRNSIGIPILVAATLASLFNNLYY